MLARLTRHNKALLYLSLLLWLLVLSIALGPEETTCTTRILKSYVYGEITDHALNCMVNLSLWVTLALHGQCKCTDSRFDMIYYS